MPHWSSDPRPADQQQALHATDTFAHHAEQEYLPKLKEIPKAEITRVVCGGCGDFKVIINQPAAEHGAWSEAKFAPEEEFLAKLKAIDGIERVEAQEFTMERL